MLRIDKVRHKRDTLDTHAFAYADRWMSKGTFSKGTVRVRCNLTPIKASVTERLSV